LIRALLDQGLPRSAVRLLRESGWDVVHVGDLGLAAASDALILERARVENRVVITLDADFHRLLAISGARLPSVVRVREEGLTAAPLARLLTDALTRIDQVLDAGAMVTVTARAVRIRDLPIAATKS
jgi:predicted nuclease of predicted toxin-antitoxin system